MHDSAMDEQSLEFASSPEPPMKASIQEILELLDAEQGNPTLSGL
jgi:hypothetical protein